MEENIKEKKKKDLVSYEDKFAQLQSIVERMQEGNLSLDESLKMYEEGIGLYRLCRMELAEMDLKIKTISIQDEELDGKENL